MSISIVTMSSPRTIRRSTVRESSSFAHDIISSSHSYTSTTEPSFTCTICWQPQYPPPGPSSSRSTFGQSPKLLGSSARIVCQPCWRAVLNLSICWVCGDCIVRGDEVVSLGWCFWHRGCFGCLICGNKMNVPSKHEDCSIEHGKWGSLEEIEERLGGPGKGIGVELNEIPLCVACQIETAGESQDEVFERGLETVSRFDGGLTRDRLDMLSEDLLGDDEQVLGKMMWTRRLRGASGIKSSLQRYINASSHQSHGSTSLQNSEHASDDNVSLHVNAIDMGASDENPTSGDAAEVVTTQSPLEDTPQQVYISVLNPIGEPAFKPSKTKPLPKWMSLLPSNIERERKQHKETGPQLKPSRAFYVDGTSSEEEKVPPGLDPKQSQATTAQIPLANTSAPINIPKAKPKRRTTSISFVDDDVATNSRIFKRSQTLDSDYATPPEYPQRSCLLAERKPTPFPGQSPPILNDKKTSPCFSHGRSQSKRSRKASRVSSRDESSYSSSMPLPPYPPPTRIEHPLPVISRPSISSDPSTEYLDRYQPTTPNYHQKANPWGRSDSITDKLKRHTARNAGQATQQSLSKGGSPQEEGKQDLDSKMQNLKQELREFFQEK